MEKVTLEKIDIIRERTGVNYTEAKEALEQCDGNVVDALVFLETRFREESQNRVEEIVTTKEEFKKWLFEIVQKGNISRIKIRKDDKTLIDVPVNAGIAAGMFSMLLPWPVLGLGVFMAVATKLTIEITDTEGKVKVVNAIIKSTMEDVSSKVKDVKKDIQEKVHEKRGNDYNSDDMDYDKSYSYTVDFNNEQEKDCQCCEENEINKQEE